MLKILFGFAFIGLLTSCGGDLQRFHVLKPKKLVLLETVYELTKHEIVDEGSGVTASGVGPGTYTLQKITIGGAYLRRTDLTDGPTYNFKAGLHGNPTATE